MTRLVRSILAVAVLAAGLSACGGGGSSNAPPTPPPGPVPPPVPLEDMFGTGFGTRFRVAANTRPTDPLAADLNAVSLTADPITI